jgi:acylphosphatase
MPGARSRPPLPRCIRGRGDLVTCLRLVIHGRVQGVWFRGWTQREAQARGLNGWVRNRRDGTVEAMFEGSEDAVASMVEACRAGPPSARVIELEEFTDQASPGSGFQSRPSE